MSEWLQCIGCARRFDASEIRYTCECGESAQRRARCDAATALSSTRDCASRKTIDKSGVWRFREAVLDVDESEIVTHPEGATRLYERGGIFFKHEGENPTGSFKDRGMTVAMTQAKRLGARAVACASTGNTSASLAAYAAQAGTARDRLHPGRKGGRGKARADARVRRDRARRSAATSTPRCDSSAKRATASASTSSTRSIRSASKGRRRSSGSCCRIWSGTRPTGSSSPPATSATPARSAKRCARPSTPAGSTKMPRLASIQASGANPFYRSYRDAFAQRHRIAAGDDRQRDPHRRSGQPSQGGRRRSSSRTASSKRSPTTS